jgi:hypothetical protein
MKNYRIMNQTLIGTKGETIKEYQKFSDCGINVNVEKDNNGKTI